MFQFLSQRKSLELFSPLSPEECLARLQPVVEERWFALDFTRRTNDLKPVAGRVTSRSLQLRKRIGYRNSFQTHLAASMSPSDNGTRISGYFGMHRAVRVFMAFWFGFLLLIGGSLFAGILSQLILAAHLPKDGAWVGLVVPPGMFCFGIGLVAFGRYLARNEAAFLTDFLIRTLEAQDLRPSTEVPDDQETHLSVE